MARATWDQVFTWRMRQQLVDPRGGANPVEIVRQMCGVQAQVTSAAETAVALRRTKGGPGAVVKALADRKLVKTWAMRGTLHAMTPDLWAGVLSLMASARTWEKPVWTKNFGATPDDIAALVAALGDILGKDALTRDELVTAIVAERRFHHLEEQLRSGWGAVLKPLAWQGALCHGPAQGSTVTFANPAHLIPDWPGTPDPDAAAPTVITAYLAAYGPATPESFDAWLTRNSLRKTTIRRWFAELGDRITEIEIEGRTGYLLTENLEALTATKPVPSVHLLGPFDQYVLGPGTGDEALLPKVHRSKVSRTAGWISTLVLVNGRIAGTWEAEVDDLVVTMFDSAKPPLAQLKTETVQVARALGQPGLALRTA
ncbi:winged helix DNA-binding domain-containing protein [Nocardia crassostreae]|uniref:winged helix DNA-binding domain-containing protein n=1 Tax=Nocardia crassostreae TaxID=53428 RepID=UPI00083590A7|nr:winged helix DNA-binding domain-containing protein [Nocardia crassostreae]